jgi:hypothetical protein
VSLVLALSLFAGRLIFHQQIKDSEGWLRRVFIGRSDSGDVDYKALLKPKTWDILVVDLIIVSGILMMLYFILQYPLALPLFFT